MTPYSTSNAKSTNQIYKSLLSFAQYFVPSPARTFDFSTSSLSSEVDNALRALYPADVRWREGRPWVLADEVGFEEGSEGKGTLTVTRVLGGAPLSPDLMVHLTRWGDFRISRVGRILYYPVPFLISKLDPLSTSTTTRAYLGRNGLMSLRDATTRKRTTCYQQAKWMTWPTSRLGLPKENSMSVQWPLLPGEFPRCEEGHDT